MPKISIYHNGKHSSFEASTGKTILTNALQNKIKINHLCQSGICGMCQILVEEGEQHLTAPTETETVLLDETPLRDGIRLACQAKVKA